MSAGWTAASPPLGRARWLQVALLVVIGSLPDLDLVLGTHSARTHSIGAALIAGACAALVNLPVARTRSRIFLVVAAAWVSHPLLDFFGEDSSPPIGVMLFWPFTTAYFHAPFVLFGSIYRNYHAPGFITHNAVSAAREVAILLPILLIVWWRRRRSSHT